MQIYRCGNTSGKKCHAKERSGKKKQQYQRLCTEIKRKWKIKCMIIPVTTGATGRVTKGFKKFGSHTRKTFDRFTTKDSCTRNITHNTESTAV